MSLDIVTFSASVGQMCAVAAYLACTALCLLSLVGRNQRLVPTVVGIEVSGVSLLAVAGSSASTCMFGSSSLIVLSLVIVALGAVELATLLMAMGLLR